MLLDDEGCLISSKVDDGSDQERRFLWFYDADNKLGGKLAAKLEKDNDNFIANGRPSAGWAKHQENFSDTKYIKP